MNEGERPRFIEPAQPAQTPEEAKRRRSTAMLTFGVIALVIGVAALSGGSSLGILLGVLGVGLLVGGLAIR